MLNFVVKGERTASGHVSSLSSPFVEELEISGNQILRGLFFAAVPTAVFWVGLFLGLQWIRS